MAEENNGSKKTVIEMSVWFIVCLVILIVASLSIMKLNADKTKLKNELAESRAQYEELQAMHTALADSIKGISQEVFVKSPTQLKSELESLLGSEENVSGDAVQENGEPVAASGEVA